MDMFWIAGTLFIAVLMHFMMSSVFGFNLLHWTYRQVLCWMRGREELDMEERGVRHGEELATEERGVEELATEERGVEELDMKEIEDTEPLPRWGHLAITVGSKVFVWGGEGSTKKDREFLRLYDMKAKKWWKRRTKGTPPQGYIACAYALIGKVLYVFGGSNGQDYYNDIYRVELELKATILEWKKCEVQNADQAPMGKRSTGMIARKSEDNRDELVVFGGYGEPRKGTLPGSSIHRTNEVHTFNIATGEWTALDLGGRVTVPMWDSFTFTKIDDELAVVIAGVQQGPGAVNSVHCLTESATTSDPEWSWVRVTTTGEIGVPDERRDHATILLGTRKDYVHLFMTGGIDKKWHSLGDAWILNLKREGQKIIQGSWLKVVGQHQDLQLKAAINTADSAPDNTEPLKPRFSLTANKCESNGSEQPFHLMVFGGIFKSKGSEITLAETTVLTLGCTYAESGSISSGKLCVHTPS